MNKHTSHHSLQHMRAAAAGLLLIITAASLAAAEESNKPAATPESDFKPYSVSFPAREARYVRVLIQSTNRNEPCIDELEIFGPDDGVNVALGTRGVKATASSCLPGYAIHRIEHLNDGQYGNGHSWIAATGRDEWAQIELAEPTTIATVTISRDREGRYIDRIPVKADILISMDGQDWQTVAQMLNRAPQLPAPIQTPSYQPPAELPDPLTWDGTLRYALLCEKATWERMDANDHLSPHQSDHPALPGGRPYWGRIARLSSVNRALVQMAEMLDRLAAKGMDVDVERRQLAELRQRSTTDEKALYLDVRLAKRRLMFRDPDLAALERILFVKRHPYLSSHNYSDVLDSQFTTWRWDLRARDPTCGRSNRAERSESENSVRCQ